MTNNYTEDKQIDFSSITNPYTNKPVLTGKSISFSQKTYDEITPLQERYNSLNDYRNGVNYQALNNIPVVPEFMQEDYNKAYNDGNQWLSNFNVATDDEIEEWKEKGKIGLGEAIQKSMTLRGLLKGLEKTPFIGTTAGVAHDVDILYSINRLKNGKEISQIEQEMLVDYLRELKEIQVRGTTLPNKAMSAILESLPFFAEFGIGVAAAPETFGGSLSLSAAALSKAAGRKAARKAIQAEIKKLATESTMTGVKKKISADTTKRLYENAMKDYIGKSATKAISEVGGKEALKIAAKTTPQSIVAANFGSKPLTYMTLKNTLGGIADRQLAGSMQVTDAGEAVFLQPENMALSIMKSFGSAIFDNYTETMGWAFAPVTSYFAKPVRNVLPKKFFTEFDKLVASKYGMKATEALKKYGYDGVIEEMGEEVLNRFLCDVFGIEGLEGYTFDGFMNNVFYANDPEQWLVEALSFAAMGGAAHGVHGGYSQIKEQLEKQKNDKALKRLAELSNKQIYSSAEFYLDQGLIKIAGSQSQAEQLLRQKFAERGIDQNTSDSYFKTASELEIREKLKQIIEEENQDAGVRRNKAVDFLADTLMKNKQGYKNKDKALQNADLIVTGLEKFSEATGKSIEELIREEAPEIRNQSEYLEGRVENNRIIDNRLAELEQEFENLSEEDYQEGGKFEALEAEYKKLVNRKNQGETYYQDANIAGAEDGEYLEAAKEWKEKRTESKYFKKWFGNSKVVDSEGKPLIVYHGTENNFKIFKNLGQSRQIGANVGFFFTDSKNMAKEYGNDVRVMPVYLSLQNPLIIEPNSTVEMFGENIEITDTFDFFTQMDTRVSEQDLKNELIKQGYDGVVLRNTNVDTPFMQDIHDVYVAFDNTQIKSVNNRGTFDAENPNIYYQSNIDDSNLIDNFGMNSVELTDMVKADIENILTENDVSADEFNLEDIRVYGSYTTNKNKETSDLDFIVQYTGTMREDDAFNMLHDADLSIEDKNGRTVTIDINPVNPAISGTIEDHIEKRYYQGEEVEYYNFDGSKINDIYNPLSYDYIHTQFKNRKPEEQEKIKLEFNPELENRKDEIIKPIEIKKTDIKFESEKIGDVKRAIKDKLFVYKNNRDVIPIKSTNRNTNITVDINAGTINESVKELFNKIDKNFIASILLNSKEIFEKSEYILTNNEAKKESLKDKQIVHRYANVIQYNKENYIVISTIFENENRPEIRIYHLTGYKSGGIEEGNQNASISNTTNISIAQLKDFVKSRVIEKYNFDYKAAKKKLDSSSNKHEEKTDTEAFKNWFGNSKVVDENGQPLKLSDDKNIYIVDGYSNNGISRYTYKGGHRAPSYSSGDVQERIDNSDSVNLEEVAQGQHNQPSDYFEPIGARYYGYDDVEGKESANVVRNITKAINAGQKNIKVTVYRAVPKDVLNTKLKNGDWITLSKTYAKVHGESNLNDNYKVISQEVPINEVWWDGNDIREWGYDNGKEQEPDLYLSIQNPKYQKDLPENWKEARKLRDEGFDGVITSDGKYLVFEKYQIKSVDNIGTFDAENPNIFYQFAGENSETSDKHSLMNAKKMLAKGENPEYVRKLTGWFKGVDGKFRYEISDKDALVNVERIKKARQDEIDYINLNIKDYNTRMSDLVDRHDAKEIDDKDFRKQYDHLMSRKLEEVDALKYYEAKGYASRLYEILDHEKLYAAYPSLRFVRVEFRPHSYGVMGSYSNSKNEISLDLTLLYGKEDELKETLMHEIQHFIQHKEDFAVGGNVQNIEIILADAKDAIENSADSKEYDTIMKEYSIVNNLLLIRAIQDNPEKITKSYWYMQQGKGWYAPRKTRKKERRKYINDCCQEFIDYSIQKHKDNKTFEGYKNYSKKDIAELKKAARRLNYKASKILDKLSPSYKHLGKIESALNQLKSFEINTFDLYRRLSGETEARNTSNRMNLSDAERLEKSPLETADVSETEQLVVFDDGSTAYSESNMSDDFQGNLFYDNITPKKLNSMNIKGSYLPAENLIELFKNADESTIVHEFAHWWLDRFVKYAKDNEEIAADLTEIRKFVKNDGGEFTREQHEKFARGFEAYIRSGYAKTNRLKKIFEDFKNALLAIYDSIKKLGFKDDDLPEIQGLFDRLLTTERERIKSTVFDKIAEIDAKIEDIKSNEENEFRQLDELWKTNLDVLNRKSEKSRTVKEYLELADKMTSRETKEIKEFKQRYKEATLSILSTASGKPTSWVANKKNWEKLQELIADVADRITTHNGFHPEWSEFYSDTGVSYENDEIDGDYNLAQQAFEVMADGRYNRTFDENYEFDDIGKFLAKLDYLHGKIKTLKGQEKEAAFEAYGQLFETMPAMPDEVVASVAETMQKIADEYEEDQKTDFNRKILNKTDLIWQLQYFITKKLNDLKVYNPETRYKMRLNKSHRLYRYIQGIHSVDGAKKQVRRINEFVIDDMRNNQRSLLHKEIQRQIKVNSKVVKIGTIAKGKFDWKTNTIFSELVEMNKLTQQEAENQIGALIQIQDAAKSENRDSYDENETGEFEKTNDFQNNLKTKFLQYRSQKIQDLDVTHTMQLLQDILELKDAGRKAKSEQDFINKTQRWNTKNNLLDILEVTKNSGAKFGANWVAGVGRFASLNSGTLANWESLLNAIFDKDTSRKYSLLADEAKSDVYARNHMKYFYDRAAKIYGFKEANNWDRFLDYDYMQPMIKLFQEYSNETYTYTQSVFSINSPDGVARSNIEISRAQMITMFAWSLNDELEQRLYTQFGIGQIRDMFDNKLSSQDRELAWALIDTCERMREDINEVFIRTTGLSLPAVQNYFPSKAERVQSDIDMYHDFFVKSSSPSFIKERKVCNRIPMKPLSPLEILIPHINKTAKYVVMSEKVNFLNQIFKDTAIKTKMQEIWGSKDGADIYQTLINKLAASTFTNYSKGTNLVAGALDTLSRNYITSSIGFSPKVALGQLLSVINYAENMPAHLWAKGFKDTLKHPVESFKYMIDNCEYLQSRLAGNSQNEVMAILTSEKDKFRTLRNFMTSNVKWGDIIAITLGGKAYVDYLMQQGMSKEEAFDKFVEDTMRAQQAGTTSSISEWQSAQAKNCLTRMFFAFRNTDMQYERKFIDTLIQAKKGEIPAKELIKKLFIYKIFNPFMFVSFLQNLSLVALFRGIFDDDQDEAIIGFLKSAIEAVMLSGMTAYGFAGFIAKSFMESIVAHFDKEYKHFETDVPVMGDIDMQVQKYLKGDLEFADYVEALALGSEFALGIPAQKIVNTSGGVGDLAQGNYGVGLSRIAGWGRYTSTKAWTGKEPEKKKKKKRN